MSTESEELARKLPYKYCGILSSADEAERSRGSSGGVITAIARHLFREGRIQGAICFRFAGRSLFEPVIARSEDEYIQSGSIYHHVPLVEFLRGNLPALPSPVFVTCIPCETLAIRRVLEKNGIEPILASFVCSGQMEKQATYDFLRKHRIDLGQVKSFSYRGNGWPSGMQVETLDGKKHFFHNLDSDWKTFFHSSIYTLSRCFRCTVTYGTGTDFLAADPWFKDFIKNEKTGCTVVCASEQRWIDLIENMRQQGLLNLHKEIEVADLVASQYWTVAKKDSFKEFRLLRMFIRIFRTPLYRHVFLLGPYRFLHHAFTMSLLRKCKRRLDAKARHH